MFYYIHISLKQYINACKFTQILDLSILLKCDNLLYQVSRINNGFMHRSIEQLSNRIREHPSDEPPYFQDWTHGRQAHIVFLDLLCISRTCLQWKGFTEANRRHATGQQPGTKSDRDVGDKPLISITLKPGAVASDFFGPCYEIQLNSCLLSLKDPWHWEEPQQVDPAVSNG